jgi:PAS domain S-box-containing protein
LKTSSNQISATILKYAISCIAVIGVIFLRYFLVRRFGEMPLFLFALPPVMIISLICGLGPGILATFLSAALLDYFFIPPYGLIATNFRDLVSLGIFCFVGISISIFSHIFLRYRSKISELSERKKADEKLRESERRLDLALASGQMGMWEWDVGTNTSIWNAKEYELLGLEPKEGPVETELFFRHVHPEDLHQLRRALEEVFKSGDEFNYEMRIIRTDGQIRWLAAIARLLRDEAGQPVRMIGVNFDITERKRAEEALRERMKEISCLYAVSRDIQEDLSIDELCRRAVGHLIQAMQFPEITVPVIELYGNRYTGENYTEGLPHGLDAEIRIKGEAIGHLRVCYAHKKPFLIPEEQNLVNSVARSISTCLERRQAEEALRESEQEFRAIFELSGAGNAEVDATGKFLRANQKFSEITGYSEQELRKMLFSDLTHPDEQERDWKKFEEAKRDKKSYVTEKRYICKDGLVKWVHVIASIIYDKNGNPEKGIGSIIDITDRKNQEEELHKLNRILHALSDSSQAVTRYQDNEKAYLDAVCRIIVEDCGYELVWIGYAEDDEHKSVRPVAYSGFEEGYLETLKISWADVERGRGPTGTAIRTGKVGMCTNMLTDAKFEPWRKEAIKRGYASSIVLPLKDSRRTFGALSIYSKEPAPFSDNEVKLLKDVADDLALGINTIRIYAAQAYAEQALRDSELREHQRAQELERLADELAYKNEELENIIRIASHDLRSPLTNIKGFSGELLRDLNKVYELLATVPLPEEVSEKIDTVFNKYVKEAVGFIQTSADSINQMLKSLMSVAKAGTMPINIQDLNMNDLLSKIAASVQLRFNKIGDHFEIQELPRCCGDADQVTQVFTNIVENAIKYREPSRPLQIRIYGAAEEGIATYCVEDNGKGIAENHLEKVFDLFTRLEPEAAKGEGLGLTIAKRMIERQGGKIWVISEFGKGSKFYVSLPC